MAYLTNKPRFFDAVIAPHPERREVLLVDGALPVFELAEHHTADVEGLLHEVRSKLGLEAHVLVCAGTRFDLEANRVEKVYDLASSAVVGAQPPGAAWVAEALDGQDARVNEHFRRRDGRLLPVEGRSWTAWSFLEEARAHIAHALSSSPTELKLEQIRSSQTSTVFRVLRGSGPVAYFKAVESALAREPEIHRIAAGVDAPLVPEVLAIDLPERWFLAAAVEGPSLDTVRDLDGWAAAAHAYGRFQRAAVERREVLAAAGCPLRTAESIGARIDGLLDDDEALRVGRPDGLSAEEYRLALDRRAALHAAAELLARSLVPISLDHGDLWPSNVLLGKRGPAVIDWEDACLSHPFLSVFPLIAGGILEGCFSNSKTATDRIRGAYVEAWTGFATGDELVRQARAAIALGGVRIAADYAAATPAARAEHPWMDEMPAFCLRHAVDALGEGR